MLPAGKAGDRLLTAHVQLSNIYNCLCGIHLLVAEILLRVVDLRGGSFKYALTLAAVPWRQVWLRSLYTSRELWFRNRAWAGHCEDPRRPGRK